MNNLASNPNAGYWTSFCSMIIAWCDQAFTLPNLVMIVAIIVPLLTYATNFYWRWRDHKERLAGMVDTRKNQDRRTPDEDYLDDA